MAGKKKKKAVANPARGFATVSVSSKNKEAIINEGNSLSSAATDVSTATLVEKQDGSVTLRSGNGDENQKAIQDMTPEELETYLETEELRNIVQQVAPKVRTDAARQIARLKSERRQLRQQAEQVTLPGLTDIIVAHSLRDHLLDRNEVARFNITTNEELDLLTRLWTLEQILVKLDMPNVHEALSHVVQIWRGGLPEKTAESVSGLETCLRWYAEHTLAADLPDYVTGVSSARELSATEAENEDTTKSELKAARKNTQ